MLVAPNKFRTSDAAFEWRFLLPEITGSALKG
jgi:hypothetical protein